MSSDAPLSPPEPLPWSNRALEQLCETLRSTAEKYEFSPRRTDRYEAWILAFLSWCSGHLSTDAASPTVDPSQIEDFREALRSRTDSTTDELHEAMDALSFLFGAVAQADGSLAVLPDGVVFGPQTTPGSTEANTPSDALRTLQVGWQKGTIASVSEATSGSSPNRLEKPHEDPGDDSNGETSETTPSTTAEAYLEQYQTQLDSLHVSDTNGDSNAK
jgi:hypothetical protein